MNILLEKLFGAYINKTIGIENLLIFYGSVIVFEQNILVNLLQFILM